MKLFEQEVAAFPECYAEYFKRAMTGGAIVSLPLVVCAGPAKYRGEKLVQSDITNVKNAAAAAASLTSTSSGPRPPRPAWDGTSTINQMKSISTRWLRK
jgi:hypothetical protein